MCVHGQESVCTRGKSKAPQAPAAACPRGPRPPPAPSHHSSHPHRLSRPLALGRPAAGQLSPSLPRLPRSPRAASGPASLPSPPPSALRPDLVHFLLLLIRHGREVGRLGARQAGESRPLPGGGGGGGAMAGSEAPPLQQQLPPPLCLPLRPDSTGRPAGPACLAPALTGWLPPSDPAQGSCLARSLALSLAPLPPQALQARKGRRRPQSAARSLTLPPPRARKPPLHWSRRVTCG